MIHKTDIRQLMIYGLCYVIAIFGLYIGSKIVFMFIALAVTDFGLDSSSNAWIWVIPLLIYLVVILYLVFSFLLKKKHGKFSTNVYMAPILMSVISTIVLFFSSKYKDCVTTEAFMPCSVGAIAQLMLIFSFLSLAAAIARRESKQSTI